MGCGAACPELGRLAGPGGGQTLHVKFGQMQLWGGVGQLDILTLQPERPRGISTAESRRVGRATPPVPLHQRRDANEQA